MLDRLPRLGFFSDRRRPPILYSSVRLLPQERGEDYPEAFIMRGYTFQKTIDGTGIYVINDREEYKEWSIAALRTMARSTGLPDHLRDLAREALASIGETVEEEDPASETITRLYGVKVFQTLIKGRFFFKNKKGRRVYDSDLQKLEEKIIREGRG